MKTKFILSLLVASLTSCVQLTSRNPDKLVSGKGHAPDQTDIMGTGQPEVLLGSPSSSAKQIDHAEPTEFPKLTEPAEVIERAIQPVTARNAKGQFETPACVHGVKASSTFQQWDCPDGCVLQTEPRKIKP